jgi:hypothetical protein
LRSHAVPATAPAIPFSGREIEAMICSLAMARPRGRSWHQKR